MPGDPARLALGPTGEPGAGRNAPGNAGIEQAAPGTICRIRHRPGAGDLGYSLLTERPVDHDIRDTFAATFELVLFTITLAFVFGIPMGVAAAYWKDRWPDNIVRLVALFSAVAPAFFLALLLQILAGYVLHVLPTTGRLPPGIDFTANITGLLTVDSLLRGRPDVFVEALRHLLLPSIALASTTLGQIALIDPLLDDRRRQPGLYRSGQGFRRAGAGAACSSTCCDQASYLR